MFWNKNKVLALASPGGHWIQLNKICNPLEVKHTFIYATPLTQYNNKKNKTQANDKRVQNIIDAAADSKIKIIPLLFQLLWLLLKERPGTIITTGAAPGVLAIIMGRYIGIKTIWIDSIANVKTLSRSGRIAQSHAHIVLTQWEALSSKAKRIHYQGAIL